MQSQPFPRDNKSAAYVMMMLTSIIILETLFSKASQFKQKARERLSQDIREKMKSWIPSEIDTIYTLITNNNLQSSIKKAFPVQFSQNMTPNKARKYPSQSPVAKSSTLSTECDLLIDIAVKKKNVSNQPIEAAVPPKESKNDSNVLTKVQRKKMSRLNTSTLDVDKSSPHVSVYVPDIIETKNLTSNFVSKPSFFSAQAITEQNDIAETAEQLIPQQLIIKEDTTDPINAIQQQLSQNNELIMKIKIDIDRIKVRINMAVNQLNDYLICPKPFDLFPYKNPCVKMNILINNADISQCQNGFRLFSTNTVLSEEEIQRQSDEIKKMTILTKWLALTIGQLRMLKFDYDELTTFLDRLNDRLCQIELCPITQTEVDNYNAELDGLTFIEDTDDIPSSTLQQRTSY